MAILRIGLVLAAGGGTLQKMVPPFKLGLGGRFGDGQQFMPWVHRDDLVAAIIFLINGSGLSGAFNGSAPHPVTNAGFTRAAARALRRPAFCHAPAPALRLALGEFSSVLLGSQRAEPLAALASGYRFRHPDLDAALASLTG